MKKPVPFKIDDEKIIYIEAEDAVQAGPQLAGRPGDDTGGKAASRFIEAISTVKPAAEILLNAFQEMNTPDEITLEFNIKFNAKLGAAVIASATSEAAFKVGLKWTNPKKEG